MAGNTFGTAFRITTFGESHGVAIGVIIDGCPAGLAIDVNFIQSELDRRRPGQSKIVTQRNEADTVKVLSGIFEGKSTGHPIALVGGGDYLSNVHKVLEYRTESDLERNRGAFHYIVRHGSNPGQG